MDFKWILNGFQVVFGSDSGLACVHVSHDVSRVSHVRAPHGVGVPVDATHHHRGTTIDLRGIEIVIFIDFPAIRSAKSTVLERRFTRNRGFSS